MIRQMDATGEIKQQMQMLAEQIAAWRGAATDDPPPAIADRVVAVKVGMIRSLQTLLASIPTGVRDVRRQFCVGAEAAAVPILHGQVRTS